MVADDKTEFDIETIRSKIKKNERDNAGGLKGSGRLQDYSWKAVSQVLKSSSLQRDIDFIGKNLENGSFSDENLEGANFSVANLTGVDFSGANLKGADLSGANLTDANLSGANLEGALLSGAMLLRTNFTGANLKGVKFADAYLEDAILLDIEIDELGIEELQALIEYIAQYYPHKLNLAKLNLTLLDLSRIDLSKVDLRGVDFTGVDFTGVNIIGLDLSGTNITPQQIAQALGHSPSKEELMEIMKPKKKDRHKSGRFDVSELFLDDGRDWGVIDLINDKGISVEALLDVGKKVFRHGTSKPQVKDEEVLKNIKTEHEMQAKSHNDELRSVIEERKQKELETRMAMKKEFQSEINKEKTQETPSRSAPVQKHDMTDKIVSIRGQGYGRE